MNKTISKAAAIFGFAALALTAHAQDKVPMDMNSMGRMRTKDMSNLSSMSSGEVKAVDRKNKTITLKHGPIKSKTVDMGAMTMTFPVQKPALLAKVRVGNKVKFIVENVNDKATVTALVVQN